jgi:hypothetical protein
MGIDPGARTEILQDYVLTETRAAELRAAEKKAQGKERLSAARALNAVLREKRQLNKALFRGAQKPKPFSTPEEAEAADREAEADAAWRQVFWGGLGLTAVESDAHERVLTERYGRPSWNALCYRSLEEQQEAERVIAAYPHPVID